VRHAPLAINFVSAFIHLVWCDWSVGEFQHWLLKSNTPDRAEGIGVAKNSAHSDSVSSPPPAPTASTHYLHCPRFPSFVPTLCCWKAFPHSAAPFPPLGEFAGGGLGQWFFFIRCNVDSSTVSELHEELREMSQRMPGCHWGGFVLCELMRNAAKKRWTYL
jgi:hypothetical protein